MIHFAQNTQETRDIQTHTLIVLLLMETATIVVDLAKIDYVAILWEIF